MINKLRILLLPFSWLYSFVLWVRHFMYDKGVLKSSAAPIPTIVVGNVSLGGTGKSPMIGYLIEALEAQYKIAVLSRGYGRSTKGFFAATENTSVSQIGDEAYMNWQKHPDAIFAVCENRVEGIEKLQELHSNIDVVLLDDAMQHRNLSGSFIIALTGFDKFFLDDFLIPAGNLRDLKSRMNHADIIVVTKCPNNFSESDANKLTARIQQWSGKNKTVLYSTIAYGSFIDLTNGTVKPKPAKALVVTGIAQPGLLYNYLQENDITIVKYEFADHYNFSEKDIKAIKTALSKLGENTVVVTTEKDAVKLKQFEDLLEDVAILVLPIKMNFLFGGHQVLLQNIYSYLGQTK